MSEREPTHVGEFMTEASVEVLNAELAERGIGPDRIITVLHVPAQTMANPTTPKFRVLYRAH
jgi:plasmid maintenance system antidote protein VapI